MTVHPTPSHPLPPAPEGLGPLALVALAARAAREDAAGSGPRPCEPEGRCYE